jgi:hypothetical protein
MCHENAMPSLPRRYMYLKTDAHVHLKCLSRKARNQSTINYSSNVMPQDENANPYQKTLLEFNWSIQLKVS